jgi:hypothetical protein
VKITGKSRWKQKWVTLPMISMIVYNRVHVESSTSEKGRFFEIEWVRGWDREGRYMYFYEFKLVNCHFLLGIRMLWNVNYLERGHVRSTVIDQAEICRQFLPETCAAQSHGCLTVFFPVVRQNIFLIFLFFHFPASVFHKFLLRISSNSFPQTIARIQRHNKHDFHWKLPK